MKRKKRGKARKSYLPVSAGPGINEYRRRLKWLLDFLNAEIDSLSVKDFLALFHDYLVFLYGDFMGLGDNTGFLRSICQDTEVNREQLKSSQGIFLKELQEVESYAERVRSIEGLEEVSIGTPIKLGYYMRSDGSVVHRPRITVHPDESDDELSGEQWREEDDGLKPTGAIFSRFTVMGFDLASRYFLYSLFERISVYTISRCPDCAKYFKKTKRKISPLCPRCLKKKTTYDWRDKNRARYNDYQDALRAGEKESYKKIWGRKGQVT